MPLFEKVRQYTDAAEVRQSGLYPYFLPLEGSDGTEVTVDGQRVIMIGSNNYLGLTHHPEVMAAAKEAVDTYGTGCTGSRFLNGNLSLHNQLDEELATFCQKEAALVFSTGYQTNLGIVDSLVGRHDYCVQDRMNHASLVDAGRMTFGRMARFRHNDPEDLDRVLSGLPDEAGKLVAVDGVFSMEGHMAHLPELLEVAQRHGARMLVDEAHSFGVMGETGIGAAEELGVLDEVDLIMGTFSKSLACVGGFVAGDRDVIDYIKHNARPLIFSASVPPPVAATALKALEILRREPGRRERVRSIARQMKEGFHELGFETGPTETPIIPVILGDDDLTFLFWRRLMEHGVYTNPVVSPAVAKGQARLRTSYSPTHTEEQLQQVLDTFARVGRELEVTPVRSSTKV